jgi:hypothetical protein
MGVVYGGCLVVAPVEVFDGGFVVGLPNVSAFFKRKTY